MYSSHRKCNKQSMAAFPESDYHDCCRLCLSKEGRQFSILESSHDGGETLRAKIFSCVAVEISNNDYLPKQVCHKCECLVNVWHYFKKECEQSQEKLKEWQQAIATTFDHNDTTEKQVCSIKVETMNEEVLVDDRINQFANAKYVKISECSIPVEGFDSSDSQLMNTEEEDDHNVGNVHNVEDSFPMLSLVISGTSSVAEDGTCLNDDPESSSDSRNVTADSARSTSTVTDFPIQQNVHQDTNRDTRCVVTNDESLRLPILEVHLEESNDADELQLPNNPCVNSFNDQDLLGASFSSGAQHFEDPLGEISEQSMEKTYVSYKIKEEPTDISTNINQYIQRSITDLLKKEEETVQELDNQQNVKGSGSFNAFAVKPEKAVVLKSKAKQLEMKHITEDSLVYHVKNLPKISNSLFDEESKFCKLCKRAFNDLWRHMRSVHSDKKPFKCAVCLQNFDGRRELVTHRVRTVSKYCRDGKQPEVEMSEIILKNDIPRGKLGRYECAQCHEKFMQMSSVKQHLTLHTGERPFFCYKCNVREFRLKRHALKHVSNCKGRNLNIMDQVQDNSSAAPTNAKSKAICKGKACENLKNEVPDGSLKALTTAKSKAPSTVKDLKCLKCNRKFSNSIGYSNHCRVECVKSHIVKSETKSVPEANSTEIGNQASLNSLLDESTEINDISGTQQNTVDHGVQGKSMLKCTVCLKEFTKKSSLQRHLKLHKIRTKLTALWKLHQSNDSLFSCDICEKSFTNKSSYKSHRAWHSRLSGGEVALSSTDSDLPVKNCNPLPTPETINKEIMTSVNDLFCCNTCNKKFQTMKSLKIHRWSHRKVLPSPKSEVKKESLSSTEPSLEAKTLHKCNICSEIFPDLSLFILHVRSHSESSPTLEPQANVTINVPKPVVFKCKLCQKEYKNRSSFRYHMMGHSGEMPYKCRSCSNKYSNPKALARHEKERHRDSTLVLRPFCCIRCKTSFVLKEDLLAHHEKCSH